MAISDHTDTQSYPSLAQIAEVDDAQLYRWYRQLPPPTDEPGRAVMAAVVTRFMDLPTSVKEILEREYEA
jgi:hypothetical protein